MSGPCQDISTAKALREKKLVRQAFWRTASMARPHMPENGSGSTTPLHPLVLPILLRIENAYIAEEAL
jgi:hypothetical protein